MTNSAPFCSTQGVVDAAKSAASPEAIANGAAFTREQEPQVLHMGHVTQSPASGLDVLLMDLPEELLYTSALPVPMPVVPPPIVPPPVVPPPGAPPLGVPPAVPPVAPPVLPPLFPEVGAPFLSDTEKIAKAFAKTPCNGDKCYIENGSYYKCDNHGERMERGGYGSDEYKTQNGETKLCAYYKFSCLACNFLYARIRPDCRDLPIDKKTKQSKAALFKPEGGSRSLKVCRKCNQIARGHTCPAKIAKKIEKLRQAGAS